MEDQRKRIQMAYSQNSALIAVNGRMQSQSPWCHYRRRRRKLLESELAEEPRRELKCGLQLCRRQLSIANRYTS